MYVVLRDMVVIPQQPEKQQSREPVKKIQRKVGWFYLGLVAILIAISVCIWKFGFIVELLKSLGSIIISLFSIPWVQWTLIIIAVSVLVVLASCVSIWMLKRSDRIQRPWTTILTKSLTYLIIALTPLIIFGILWALSAANVLPYSWFNFFYAVVTVLGILVGLVIAYIAAMFAYQQLPSDNSEQFAETSILPSDAMPTSPQPSPSVQPLPAHETIFQSILDSPTLATDPQTIQQREEVVKEIYARLTRTDTTAVVLTGISGIGKSTLAALVYKYAEGKRRTGDETFAAKTLWLNVSDNVTMVNLAETLLKALDRPLPDFGKLAPQNQAAALFHAMNAGGESRLVILNQFENVLNPQTGFVGGDRPGVDEWLYIINSQPCCCKVLLTSRFWPKVTRSLPGYMKEYLVKGLNTAEGLELLQKGGVEATEEELRSAVEHCEGHAYALALLTTSLREGNLHLTTLLRDLAYKWQEDIALHILDQICELQLTPLQRKLLVSFSVYREPVPLEAACVVMDADLLRDRVLDALSVLLRQCLLQSPKKNHYQLHAIVADYAHAHFVNGDQPANQYALQTAHAKAAQYYWQQAAKVCPSLEKRRSMSDVQPLIEASWQLCQAGQCSEAFHLMEQEQLFSALRRWGGYAILLELCQLFLPSQEWQPTPHQEATIYSYLGRVYRPLGKKEEARVYFERALERADAREKSTILNDLGQVYSDLGRRREAWQHYRQALGINREIGNSQQEAEVLNNLGLLDDQSGRKGMALNKYAKALEIRRRIGDREGEGVTLNNLGMLYRSLGNLPEAERCYQEALEIRREVGDRGGEGITCHNLGVLYHQQGEEEKALEYYERALTIYREIGDRGEEGTTLDNQGQVYRAWGQLDKALELYEQAWRIHLEVGNRVGEGTTLSNLGALFYAKGKQEGNVEDYEEALKYYERALTMSQEVEDRGGEGVTLNNMGAVYAAVGNKPQALIYYAKALAIRREVQHRIGEGNTLHNLGKLYLDSKDYRAALACFVLAQQIFQEVDRLSDREDEQRAINSLRDEIGEPQFHTLLTEVEPQASQIVHHALRERLP